jgi:hypothetical protein
VDDWSDVTEELLLKNKIYLYLYISIYIYIDKILSFKNKYPKMFTDLDSIHELLIQT